MKNKIILGIGSNGKQAGKSTFAQKLIDNNRDKTCQILNFANPLKGMIYSLLKFMGVNNIGEHLYGDKKEDTLPVLGVSTRYLMQTLGTEWGRKQIQDDMWISLFDFAIDHWNVDVIINDSVRFVNEVKYFNQLENGLLIKVKRPSIENNDGHESEKEIVNELYDVVIYNDSTIEDLEVVAKRDFLDDPEFYQTKGKEYHRIWCSEI